MANLIVTFGRGSGDPPVMYGSGRRTEVLAIGGSAVATTMANQDGGAQTSENCADMYADTDCWVEIGAAPVASAPAAAPNNKSFAISAGERHWAYLRPGEKVSVIAL